MQIKNIGAAALPALFHLFEAVSGRPCLRLPRCPCTLPVWPPPCKDSCKGRISTPVLRLRIVQP